MDLADDLRAGSAPEIVVALEIVGMILEALAAIAGLVQLIALDHGAHGAVEDQDALLARRASARRCVDRGSLTSALTVGERLCRAQAQQMADGIDEVGAVQRVEMKLADALVDEADAPARRQPRQPPDGGSPGRRPSLRNARPSQSGTLAPDLSGKAGALLEIVDRDDARHDGNVDAGGADAVEIAEDRPRYRRRTG